MENLFGAVTHVLVNDPSTGYAVFGDLMIKQSRGISWLYRGKRGKRGKEKKDSFLLFTIIMSNFDENFLLTNCKTNLIILSRKQ